MFHTFNFSIVVAASEPPRYIQFQEQNNDWRKLLNDIRANQGDLPLHCAIINGTLETLEELIALNADVNSYNNLGLTPLMTAAVIDRPEAVHILLKSGAKVDLQTNRGLTALALACKAGRSKVVQLLATTSCIIIGNDVNFLPMGFAILSGNVECIRLLKNNGASLEDCGQGRPALVVAVATHHIHLIAELLGLGARLDGRYNGQPIMHVATHWGNLEMLEELHRCGADFNSRDSFGMTALMFATRYRESEVDC